MGEKRDMKPILLKFGLALALSFAGFLYSRLRTKRTNPSTTSPKGCPSGQGSEVNLGGGIRAASSSCNTVSEGNILDAEKACIDKVISESDNSPTGLSPSSEQNGEKDESLLPEFNDLVKEVDFGATIVGNSCKKDVETPMSKEVCPMAYASPEKDDYEREIMQLRNMVRMLQEREQSLEVQLLEYCGLREQETAARELQNRLKVSIMEAKMFNLKVETLRSENRRLEAQVADHAKVLAELEATKEKIKLLKRKIRHEAEQNREQIIALQQRVAKLQDQECKTAACDQDIQVKLQKLKDLESEVEELRKSNLRLQTENSDLARRLDSTQILANSVLEDPEADALKEESERLRKENDGLMKEIEQLQADRCSDVEELVYLRWINACLRYELRNYQPPPGKTVARDLSKSLSPTSEKKAKQLILEYANSDGPGSIVDFDSDQWSSSLASFLADSGECDDCYSVDNSSAARTNATSKTKLLSKLRQLIRGKDSHHRNSQVSLQEKSESREDSNSPHFRLSTSTGNDNGTEGLRSELATPAGTSRTSFDFPTLTSLNEGDRRNSGSTVVGSSKKFSRRKGHSEDFKNRHVSFSDSSGIERSDLEKYAEALKDSSASAKHHRRRRSASYVSF